MFIPLYDGKPLVHIRLQWVTLSIIALNFIAFVLLDGLFSEPSGPFANAANVAFGHIPSVSHDLRTLPPQLTYVPDSLYWMTTITSAFLHADAFHLGGNMLFLWIFGDNVEDAMGHIKFLIFYLACAFAAAWFHAFMFPTSDAPLIGASGAAAGIVAAYLMLHPKMKLWVLFFARIPIKFPAALLLSMWVIYQFVNFIIDPNSDVSWAAHVGGIVAGIALVVPLKRKEVPLFDREIVLPKAVEPIIAPPNIEPAQPWGREASARRED